MKKKIEYVVIELNQPSEAALERFNRMIYEMITDSKFVEEFNRTKKVDDIETKKRS